MDPAESTSKYNGAAADQQLLSVSRRLPTPVSHNEEVETEELRVLLLFMVYQRIVPLCPLHSQFCGKEI